MNGPTPSLAILAILAVIAVVLALIFLWRKYESPRRSADAMSRAAVVGDTGPMAIEAHSEDYAATVGG